MTSARSIAALAAACLTIAPAAAQQRCVSPAEAESLALVAMPDIIRETRRICTDSLPPASFIRGGSGPLLAKYQAEADRAWPAAKKALVRLSDPMFDSLLDSMFARPLLASLLVPQLVGRIDVRDCGTIDRMAALLQPLPPQNTAGLIVTTLQYVKAQKAKKNAVVKDVPDLPICETRP